MDAITYPLQDDLLEILGNDQKHLMVQQDSQTRFLVGTVFAALWIDMIVTMAGSLSFSWTYLVQALFINWFSNLKTWLNNQGSFQTLLR